MQRKWTLISLAGFCIAVVFILVLIFKPKTYTFTQTLYPAAPNQNGALQDKIVKSNHVNSIPSRSERSRLTETERLSLLEQYGQVPEDAVFGDQDWVLAQETTWWGKPLDSKKFWENRVVWRDKSAELHARRHGREWPPIPYEDILLSNYPDDKMPRNSFVLESPNIQFEGSSKERAFWDKFEKTTPKPSDELMRKQMQLAEDVMVSRHHLEKGNYPAVISAQTVQNVNAQRLSDAIHLGYPNEAFTDDALFWAYVFKCRQDFERTSKLPSRLSVDEKLITEPLNDINLKAANAWKVTYLQRLRREKVDESYINAYLKAWNLSAETVFTKP